MASPATCPLQFSASPASELDRSGRRYRGRGGCFVIAIVHAEELLESVPVEEHDATVGAVLAGAELVRVTP